MTAAASERIPRLRIDWSEPGTIVSAAAHAALLVALLVSFSSSSKLQDAQESIPVETVTNAQFNEIMKGEKTAKAMPHAQTKVDRVAPVEVRRPSPPTPQAKVDVPSPPAQLKRTEDPGQDDLPAAAPPKKTAALPPPAAERAPPKVEPKPPKVEPKPEPKAPEAKKEPPPKDDPDAEIVKPAARPAPKKHAEKPPPKPLEKPVEKPTRVAKKPAPKSDPKSRTDKVAKLLEEKKLEELAADDPPPKPEKPHKHHAKPRSGTEATEPDRHFDPSDIAKLLNKEAPQSTGSTGRKASKVASLGAPNSNAPRLSPFFMNQLGQLITSQYFKCWGNQGLGDDDYIPRFDIRYNPDWTLAARPVLLNKPATAKQRALADSALRAITNPDCNPLKIPSSYAPYYEQWRHTPINFDPKGDGSAG